MTTTLSPFDRYDPLTPHKVHKRLFDVFKELTTVCLENPVEIDAGMIPILELINQQALLTTRFCCESHPEEEDKNSDNYTNRGYMVIVISEEDIGNKTYSKLLNTLFAVYEKLSKNNIQSDCDFHYLGLVLWQDEIDYLRLNGHTKISLTAPQLNQGNYCYPMVSFNFTANTVEEKQIVLRTLFEEFKRFKNN